SALRKLVQRGSTLRAVAITGTWGCGKTHLVNAYLDTAAAEKLLKASSLKYVYVSLFGLSTLQEVRRRISTAVIGSHAQKLLGVPRLLSNLAAPVWAVAGLEVNLSGLGESTAALIEDKVTHGLVVCFDDLERAPEGIMTADLFGLISELIEQRQCKCIVIFNREKLTDDAKSRGALHEEKIFDLVLDYRPTIEENLALGIENQALRAIVKPVFEAFANSNIRIMRRVEWAVGQLDETRVPHLDDVRTRLVRNAATLCLLKYAHADQLPDLAVLCEPANSIASVLGYSDFGKQVPESVQELLKAVGYVWADFDGSVIELLLSGSFHEPTFARAVASVHAELRQNAERGELDAIWESLRQGFTQNGANFAQRLRDFLNRPLESIRPAEILHLCELLLSLVDSTESTQLVHRLVAPYLAPYRLEQREAHLKGFPEILRLGIHESAPYVSPTGQRDLNEIFESIAGRPDSWDPNDSRELDRFEDDEIEAFLLNYRNEHALAQLKNLVSRVGSDHSAASDRAKARQDRVTAILERIAQRDPLYRYQIKVLMTKFR
ncbi:MAG TPA: hypothetical protein PKX00_07360, partial [Opitutaceae bacterium]|nr:hypothetical protein [Opitutaceae bacterium]